MPEESRQARRDMDWYVKFSGADELYRVWGRVRAKVDDTMTPAILMPTQQTLQALYSSLLTWFSETAFLMPRERIDWHVERFAEIAGLIRQGGKDHLEDALRRLIILRIYIDKDVQQVRALLPTAKEPPVLDPDRFAKIVLALAGDTAEVQWDE